MADLLAQVVLLLTAHLGKAAPGQPKPLGPAEYGRFALWLRERGLHPESLLLEDPNSVLADWADSRVTLDRIKYLLGRAAAVGLAVEKWERAGLWVITRADPDYPTRFKKLLKTESPPVLIGSGNRSLLNVGGVAVVGSRDASNADCAFAVHLGAMATREGVCLVSGGAGGIDESAMLGALESGGTAVGVLADHLLRAATSTKYRGALLAERLALVSPFNPEAAFDVGNAMARNRYIYCLADAAVVVATGEGKGGTWNGAIQNLREGWVPLWAKRRAEDTPAMSALVAKGGRWLPENFCMSDLLTRTDPEAADNRRDPTELTATARPDGDFYDLFLMRIESLTEAGPATFSRLAEVLNLHKSQLNLWLDRAVGEGRLTKLSKPVRYVWAAQPSLFREAN